MPIQPPIDYVVELARVEERDVERRALERLAGVTLSGEAARDAWHRLLEHKWYMSERMGRDVGLRVAAVDFFENVEPPGEARTVGQTAADRHEILHDPVRWLERVLSGAVRSVWGERSAAMLVL